MLDLNRLNKEKLEEIRTACAYLFSMQLARNDGFIRQLKVETIKNAFRKQAKRYHPDLHNNEPEGMLKKSTERFIRIRHSYDVLISHISKGRSYINEQRNPIHQRRKNFEERRQWFNEKKRIFRSKCVGSKKIIAVGGAKGGIGKSIFSSNLGVFLSSMGFKTVVVDLDLGGANLHLYLGESFLKWNVNDYLSNKVGSLNDVMFRTRYGPYLIGGDSSHFGSANIDFSLKLKLLKALIQIEADYIILDLGGDTSYNILDFFLTADYGIVLTTCNPASYLDAYNFIKVALFRKIKRIFGPESTVKLPRNKILENIIHDFTFQQNESKIKKIPDFLAAVENQTPESLPIVKRVLSTYKPQLIVNKITKSSITNEIVNRIQEVSHKSALIEVNHIGNISFQEEIDNSSREMIPRLAQNPNGKFAMEIETILVNLFKK
ncbi:MAG: AAA family ATPase [Chitinispirillia bacterium]|jgi:flagellar biosynthesis protein FlhG